MQLKYFNYEAVTLEIDSNHHIMFLPILSIDDASHYTFVCADNSAKLLSVINYVEPCKTS